MFGAPLMAHDRRYDAAIEWLEIIRRLWTEDEAFDFEGEFYHVKQATMQPKPIQKPHPVVMSAGASPRGRHFAAKYADVAFTNLEAHDPESLRARVESYRKLAREEYGREVKIWSLAYVVQADTEAAALKFHDHYVKDKGDWAAATNALDTMGLNAKTFPPGVLDALKAHFIAGWGGYPLVGAPARIADEIGRLASVGLDGALISWPRYEEGLTRFIGEVMPLVEQQGLRKAVVRAAYQ
jgi:alkanesulfonate monooxygenase SsuD/methylene tetrahydromethanopterin reductase-like flavin-dependent oxidoreductase (luciferase family)